MHHKKMATGFKLLILLLLLIVFCPVTYLLSGYIYHHSRFWEALARATGSSDLEGTILMSQAAVNLIAAIIVYRLTVRKIEKILNK